MRSVDDHQWVEVAVPDASSDSFTWSEDSFMSDDTRCAARIYRPTSGSAQPTPVIVMGHGFASVRALRLYAYAERFAAAGYVVVVFDYRGFGDSDGSPRQLLDVAMQHADWRAALGFARALPYVDPAGVVAWGTSFAGGHVITLAGQGEPLAAIIAQVPHVSGPAAVKATGLRASLRVGLVGVRDQISALLRREPVYVESVGLPGQTAVMTSPDAAPGLERLLTDSAVSHGAYPTTVAARIVLKIGLYSPERFASGITCPALIQIAEHDAVTPSKVAKRTANKIPRVTIREYDCGHFDPYVEPMFTTAVADQLLFLREHVPVADAP